MSTTQNKKTAAPAAATPAAAANTAMDICSSILLMFHGGNLTKEVKTKIVDRAYDIANVFEKSKALSPHKDTARLFLISLLGNQHVLNLKNEQIGDLVTEAFDLANAFHRK